MDSSPPKFRIGIYSGTFDPVHSGHIAFALMAAKKAKLDRVVFLPERQPRHKHPEHYAHRVAMLNRALRPYPNFMVLEMVERNFTIAKTLPHLYAKFGNNQLVFLFGSDVARHVSTWLHSERLTSRHQLVVGLREGDSIAELSDKLQSCGHATYVAAQKAAISSGKVRAALGSGSMVKGLLTSVVQYTRREWLYINTSRK